jgi:hypothetical protein
MTTTPPLSRSAKLYQERHLPADRNTRRRPGPRSDLGRNRVHTIPLEPPLPTVQALHQEDVKPPDAGLTEPWAHGAEELT